MADNVTADAGAGGATFAADDIGGVHYPRTKIVLGADGAADLDLDSGQQAMAASLPVVIASNQSAVAVDASGATVPVSNAGLTSLNGAIAGTEVQVDVVAALPAGNNNIGDVDVASVVPGTGATNLGKAEDAVHSSGDTGVMALVVRQNSQSDLGADGDYVPMTVDDAGGLRVSIVAGAGSGGTSSTDGTAFVADTTVGTPMMGVFDSSPPAVTDGDLGVISIDADRRIIVAPGSSEKLDDEAFTLATDSVVMVGVIRDDSLSTLTAVEGDAVPLRVSSTGALHVTGAGGGTQFAEDAAHTTADVGTVALAVRRDSAAVGSGTDGDYSTINVDSTGRLWCNVSNTVTVASHAVTNAGTFATQVDGAALTALQLIDNPVLVDDAAFTPATSSVMMAGFEADETSADSVDEGDAGAGRMTLDRKIIVTPRPSASGGCSALKVLDSDESEDEIKASAGTLYNLYCFNSTNAILYVKLYNDTAANVSVGTTTPVMTIPVPGNNDTDGAGVVLNFGPGGLAFSAAITIATTTGLADNDTGAPGANAMTLAGSYF